MRGHRYVDWRPATETTELRSSPSSGRQCLCLSRESGWWPAPRLYAPWQLLISGVGRMSMYSGQTVSNGRRAAVGSSDHWLPDLTGNA